MNSDRHLPENIDEYIKQFPQVIQDKHECLRKTIRSGVPDAKETINYQIPILKPNGNLVHFAAYKKHIGFYPTPSGIEVFRNELSQPL